MGSGTGTGSVDFPSTGDVDPDPDDEEDEAAPAAADAAPVADATIDAGTVACGGSVGTITSLHVYVSHPLP